MIDAFIGFVSFVAIIGGLGAGIFFFSEEQLHQAKKWRQFRQWSKAQDYALPKRTGPIGLLLIVLGLVCGILPGVLLIALAIRRDQNYEKEMRFLMNKWIDAGKPLTPSK